jgi:hypothetical protein
MKKENSMDCDFWSEHYYDYLASPAQTPREAARHFESCEQCRRRIEELRQELDRPSPPGRGIESLLALQMGLLDRWVSCRTCRPFLPLFAGDSWRVRIDTPVRRHIEACPACREDLEVLKGLGLEDDGLLAAAAFLSENSAGEAGLSPETAALLHRIAGRNDSDVLTRTSLGQGERDTEPELETVVRMRRRESAQRKGSAALIWARRISAAAAVLLIVTFLYLQAPAARGFSIRDVFSAVGRVHTACIVNTYVNGGEVPYGEPSADMKMSQEIWVSDPLGLILYKSNGTSVLVDQNGQRLLTRKDGTVQQGPYTEFRQIHKPWGLLPFPDLSQLPSGYEWRPSGETNLFKNEEVKVYDLIWRQGPVIRTWKAFLNSEGLPVRIELWDRLPEKGAQLITVTEVTYPSTEEVREILRGEGFQGYGDQLRVQ